MPAERETDMEKNRLRQIMNSNPDGKLRDMVAELLYDDIVSLRIAPGSRLNVNQIAAALGIGPESVKTHLKGIMTKLDCPNATSAVGRAYELGILRA